VFISHYTGCLNTEGFYDLISKWWGRHFLRNSCGFRQPLGYWHSLSDKKLYTGVSLQ